MAPGLAERAQDRLNKVNSGPKPSSEKFYDKILNPEGPINLATAENSLMSPELLQYIHMHFRMTEAHLKYRSSLERGFASSTVRAMPRFLNRSLKPSTPITPEQTVIGPGIGGVFAQLIWHLCDEGDGVLMTAPFYYDYVRDIVYPAQAVPVIVHLPVDFDPLSPEVISYMRQTIRERRKQGMKVSAVILCNPHNPLARVYPTETILAYASLAAEENLHLIVDEVFANEIFSSSSIPFISSLSLDLGPAASQTYVLAGPTKDFGASGVKVGALVSQHNPDILKLLAYSLYSTPVSAAADAVLTTVLDDEAYCDWFLDENRCRLKQAYELIAGWCDFHTLSYVPAQAGVFLLLDFASLLHVHGEVDTPIEEQMGKTILAMRKGGVLLTSSATTSQDPIPTRCRVVFSLPKPIMQIVFHRLEAVFKLKHWQID